MILKNLTDNAKNLAANAKIEDMSKLFRNHMAGKQDVKNALSGVMVSRSLLVAATIIDIENLKSINVTGNYRRDFYYKFCIEPNRK